MEQIIGMKDATQWTAHSAALQRGRGGWGGIWTPGCRWSASARGQGAKSGQRAGSMPGLCGSVIKSHSLLCSLGFCLWWVLYKYCVFMSAVQVTVLDMSLPSIVLHSERHMSGREWFFDTTLCAYVLGVNSSCPLICPLVLPSESLPLPPRARAHCHYPRSLSPFVS